MRSLLISLILALLASPARAAAATCASQLSDWPQSDRKARQAIIHRIAQDDRLGLSCLEHFLDAAARTQEDYSAILSGIALLETDAAAKALYKEVKATNWDPQIPADYLAAMGHRALPLLIKLSKKKKFKLSRSPDELPIHPHFAVTSQAHAARKAIARVTDREALPRLIALASNRTPLTGPAFQALARISASGAEEPALLLWSEHGQPAALRAAALGYLLSVDRERYLPLLKRVLADITAESQRLIKDAVPPSLELEDLVTLVLHAGSDSVVAGPFSQFLATKAWHPATERDHAWEEAALAILALGLTHDAAARPILIELLEDDAQFAPLSRLEEHLQREHPRWPRFLVTGTADKPIDEAGLPASLVAAVALAELGDSSAIPAIEEAAGRRPRHKKAYEEVIAGLRPQAR